MCTSPTRNGILVQFLTRPEVDALLATIVSQIARHENLDRFDHRRPADILLRRRDQLLPQFSDETLDKFGQLFERINATFPEATT